MRESFVMYTNYSRKIKLLTIEQRGVLLTAILAYEAGEDIPQLDDMTTMAFEFIKDDLDANRQKYEDTCNKNRENAQKRWQNKKKSDATASDRIRVDANHADNEYEYEYEYDNEHEYEYDVLNNARARAKDTTHTPAPTQEEPVRVPTIDVVADESVEKGYNLSFDSIKGFMEYNQSHGWKMNWHDALKKWADREKEREKKKAEPKKNNFTSFENQHQYDFDALKGILAQPAGGTG